jgi:DNA mismatch endonuclease (patch repair protein)
MTDIFTAERRSWLMSRVRGKDTTPEKAVRSFLHRLGFRFRLHDASLPGKPDIVLPRYRTVIFVNGCFWHGHRGCGRAKLPSTRPEFWSNKISMNMKRDQSALRNIRQVGWKVIVVWECQTHTAAALERNLRRLLTEREH